MTFWYISPFPEKKAWVQPVLVQRWRMDSNGPRRGCRPSHCCVTRAQGYGCHWKGEGICDSSVCEWAAGGHCVAFNNGLKGSRAVSSQGLFECPQMQTHKFSISTHSVIKSEVSRCHSQPVNKEISRKALLLLLLLSCFSRVRLCETPETAAHQASPSLGFSRQEHWSGLPFPSPVHESEKWKWSHLVVPSS